MRIHISTTVSFEQEEMLKILKEKGYAVVDHDFVEVRSYYHNQLKSFETTEPGIKREDGVWIKASEFFIGLCNQTMKNIILSNLPDNQKS